MADTSETVFTEKPKTRSSTELWLIGQQIKSLDLEHFRQLPTNGQVLRRLFYDLKTAKLSLSSSCSNVANEVLLLYYAANIPATQKPNIVAKLKKLYQNYISVGKNKARQTDRQREIEAEFIQSMTVLFDVAHADSEKIIRIPEDSQFLADQREGRKMTMGHEDTEFRLKEQKKMQRKLEETRRTEKAKETQAMAETVTIVTDDEENPIPTSSLTDDEFSEISQYHRRQTTPHSATISAPASDTYDDNPITPITATSKFNRRRLIDNPLFVSSLDRTKTTPRQAMHIVAPALQAVGVNVDKLTLCTTSLYEARKNVRRSIGQDVRKCFSPEAPLIAHFDGKLLPDCSGANADRMPIVVSGKNVEKLLAIPKLSGSGTGLLMGNAVVEALRQWPGVPEWLAGLCFDTTSANTGIHTGAITVIQKAFDKRLLFLACRHHILEIVASAVFDLFFASSGPNIPIFGRFKEQWQFLNQADYSSIDKNTEGFALSDNEKMWLSQNCECVAQFLADQLATKQPRDDYAELLRVALVALGKGDLIPGGVRFSPPGAYHRARWMAKGLYCLKMLCFREQFPMNAHELQAMKRIGLFTTTLYLKAWYTAPVAYDAPYNDLSLLQQLETFQGVDSRIAQAALHKLKGHLWYLSEDLLGGTLIVLQQGFL